MSRSEIAPGLVRDYAVGNDALSNLLTELGNADSAVCAGGL